MVMIPPLKTAFCGCSVRTGSKVIGWVTIVLGILEFIVISVIIGMLSVIVSSTDDESMGRNTLEMLHRSEDPELANVKEMKSLHSILEMLIRSSDTSDPEVLGRQMKDQLQAIFTFAFFSLVVIISLHLLFSTLLLIGVYKKKSGYVLFYLVICVVGLLCYFPVVLHSYASFHSIVSTTIAFFIHLYFTWVIYSFYKELRNPNFYAGQTLIVPFSEQKQLHGDVPILVHTVPNDYYYTKK